MNPKSNAKAKPRAIDSREVRPADVGAAMLEQDGIEAEQSILGALLMDNAAFGLVPSELQADDFYRRPHRLIYAAIVDLLREGRPADALTVCESLRAREQLDAAGGPAYLSGLPDHVVSTANVGAHAVIVRENAVRNRLLHALSRATAIAGDKGRPLAEMLGAVENELASARTGDVVRVRHEREVVKSVLRAISERFETGKSDRAITTGLRSVDQVLRIGHTDLGVVAADSGGGKSIFMSQVARHVGVGKNARPVLIASLEMEPEQLVERRVMDVGSVSLETVRAPRTDESQKKVWDAADEIYATTKIRYLERCWDLPTILAEATRRKRTEGLALLIVDYLQIIEFAEGWGQLRDQQIGVATRSLKRFAMQHEVPVIIASQLRKHDGRVPTKDDLRESGNIGNDANWIGIIYQPGLIDGTLEHKKGDLRVAKFLLAKQRQGPSMLEIDLVQQFEHARFREPEADPQGALAWSAGAT